MSVRWFTLFLMFGILLEANAEQVSVPLRTARPCKAFVEETGDAYRVSVEMLPVRCFDPATNISVSYQKAGTLAMSALLHFLEPQADKKTLQCSGVEYEKRSCNAQTCTLVCRIPREGVTIVSAKPVLREPTVDLAIPTLSSGSLLTRQSDYSDTIRQLFTHLQNQAILYPCSADEKEAFAESVAALEETMENAVASLQKTIEDDRELLSLERTPLLEELQAGRKRRLTQLQKVLECGMRIENLRNARLKPEYAEILLASPELLEMGGVRFVESDREIAVVAVASTISPEGKSSSHLHKAQKIAKIKAMALFAEEKAGKQVDSHEKSIDKTVVTIENGEENVVSIEEYSRIIETHATALVRGLNVVGKWESEDGKLLFIALGNRKLRYPAGNTPGGGAGCSQRSGSIRHDDTPDQKRATEHDTPSEFPS